jgi:hypothetical protein
MFIVTVHYWEDDGEGAAPRLESIEAKFSNEHAVRRYVEEEIQWENTELVECPALKIREYGTYAAMRKK